MSDPQWVQVRPGDKRLSWHILATFTRVPGVAISLCKHRMDAGTVRDTRPGNAKTCESCYRRYVGDTDPEPDLGPFGDSGAAPV